MQIRNTTVRGLALVAVVAIAGAGCNRKSADGSSESSAPAPEIVMPETATPTAVESAPTLTPGSEAAAPAAPAAGIDTTGLPTTAPPAAGANDPGNAAGLPPVAAMPPPADPLLSVAQGKASAIDAGLAGYTMRNQPQVFGDVRSDVSVYTSAGQVVLIEEKLTTSDNSIATNRYYFDGGNLFYYSDDGRWLDLEPPKPLVTRNTKRSMAFTAGGKLITASKSVDGLTANLGEYEAVAVLARAQQLLGGPPPAAREANKTEPAPAKAEPAVQKPAAERPPATAEAAPVADAAKGERVQPGRSGRLKGTAPVRGTRDFVVQARAGQLLTLGLEGAPNAVFAVYSSRGEIVSDLTNWSSKLPRDGEYTIKVGQTGGSAPVDFVLNLKLE